MKRGVGDGLVERVRGVGDYYSTRDSENSSILITGILKLGLCCIFVTMICNASFFMNKNDHH